ncbi:P-loop containing nucleoside triphosphate hydrolase protein [Meredithblackwellia eburnea MCA 4105]
MKPATPKSLPQPFAAPRPRKRLRPNPTTASTSDWELTPPPSTITSVVPETDLETPPFASTSSFRIPSPISPIPTSPEVLSQLDSSCPCSPSTTSPDDDDDCVVVEESFDDSRGRWMRFCPRFIGGKVVRPLQVEAIEAALRGKSVLLTLPTGGGKSLCMWVPALVDHAEGRGATVIVVPLVSLIVSFEARLEEAGVPHFVLRKGVNSVPDCLDRLERNIDSFSVVLATAEKLVTSGERVLQFLHKRNKLARIVLEEAHYVFRCSEDARGFRHEYRKSLDLVTLYPGVPISLATATLTRQRCLELLRLYKLDPDSVSCITSPSTDRENIFYEVVPKQIWSKGWVDSGLKLTLTWLLSPKYRGKTAIVFCATVKQCQNVAEGLRKQKLKVGLYYSDYHDKAVDQKKWLNGTINVMVATNAFSLGIDHPNVRIVIHYSLPSSITSYCQEVGRAGRNGEPSLALLLYSSSDYETQLRLIDGRTSKREKDQAEAELVRLLEWVHMDGCRRNSLLSFFESLDPHCVPQYKCCDNCKLALTRLPLVEYEDVTPLAKAAVGLVGESTARALEHRRKRLTAKQAVAILYGTSDQSYEKFANSVYAHQGRGYNKNDLLRMFDLLIVKKYLNLRPIDGGPSRGCQFYLELSHDFGEALFSNGDDEKPIRDAFRFAMVLSEPRKVVPPLPSRHRKRSRKEDELRQSVDTLFERCEEELKSLGPSQEGFKPTDAQIKRLSRKLPEGGQEGTEQLIKLRKFVPDANWEEFLGWYYGSRRACKVVEKFRKKLEELVPSRKRRRLEGEEE